MLKTTQQTLNIARKKWRLEDDLFDLCIFASWLLFFVRVLSCDLKIFRFTANVGVIWIWHTQYNHNTYTYIFCDLCRRISGPQTFSKPGVLENKDGQKTGNHNGPKRITKGYQAISIHIPRWVKHQIERVYIEIYFDIVKVDHLTNINISPTIQIK